MTATDDAGPASATSNSLAVKAAPIVVLKVSTHGAVVGKTVTISGKVTSFLGGAKTVCVCRKLSGKLTVLKRLTLSSSGAFRWTMKFRKTGTWALVATCKAAGVTSSSKTVTVVVRA